MELTKNSEQLQEFRVTVIRKGKRNIPFKVYAYSLTEACKKGKERYNGDDYQWINARPIGGITCRAFR